MACGRPARSTVTNGSATPRRAARSRCERRSTSAGGSRGPSERAMSGRVAPSADRHLRRRARPERHAPRPDRRQLREMLRRPPWSLPCTSGAMRSVSGRGSMAGGRLMERLQWWVLLLSAVMFSMSGCASAEAWQHWSGHQAHFASARHLAFSVKSHPTSVSITEAHTAAAAREEWWGRLVPEDPALASVAAKATPVEPGEVQGMDLTGRWRGRWVAHGPFGDRRESDAGIAFVQYGTEGTGRVKLADTV